MARKKKTDADETPSRPRAPEEFCAWWYPTSQDQESGASIGGHPDAARMWARKDPGRWCRRAFGIKADNAWLCQCYQDEYNSWIQAGRPERAEPFISLCVPREDALAFIAEMTAVVKGDKDA